MIGLEFVLRLDPKFTPARNLKRQLAGSPDEIDLGDIIAQLQAPTTEAINGLLIEAVDDFNSREFLGAKDKVEKVLMDLPGHQEARDLRDQIEKALKIESQVGQFLIQAREALGNGDPQEAANFVMMAQALDPHHTGIASTLKEIDDTGGLALSYDAPQPTPIETDPNSPPSRPATTGETPQSQAHAEVPAPAATPSPLPDQPEAADQEDAFAVEFDTQDPFAGLIESTPEKSPAESTPEFGAGAGDDVSFPPMDDTADLFTAPRAEPDIGDGAASAVQTGSGAENLDSADIREADEESIALSIQELIEKGRSALDDGDQPLAISIWSRVFLFKPAHPEAGHLIEKAKKALAATEAEIESLLAKARDIFDEGEYDPARLLINKALALRPNHLDVHVLKEKLDREQGVSAAAAASQSAETSTSAAPELPKLDDDLFGDVADETPAGSSATDVAAGGGRLKDDLFRDDGVIEEFDDFQELSLIGRLRSMPPLRMIALAGFALAVILVGVWLGGKMITTEPEDDDSAAAVSEVLIAADHLFKQNKGEEALHLLREFPAAGLSQQRIEMRIAKYEESLAPPTPTPIPEHAVRAEVLLEQGLWWSAYTASGEGLISNPDDPGLAEIRGLIIDSEPEAPVLENALNTRNYRAAVSITEELLLQYPEQGDLMVVLERSFFNAALAESRAYNLTGAENYLLRLLELKPEDEEAVRFLEFVQKYKVRAADMRLEIFIRSMDER